MKIKDIQISASLKYMLEVRLATMDDAMDLLRWKNDTDTRRFSIIAKNEIRVEDHLKWLSRTLQDANVRLYMILKDSVPVGDIRFDIADRVEVSVRIDRPYRNQGIGSWAVANIVPTEMQDINKVFFAKIVNGNKPSMKIFNKNGFRFAEHIEGVNFFVRTCARTVSAILIKYKRPGELNQIIRNLKGYDFIDEILIKDNTRDNSMLLGRYEKMHDAKNDTIYVQDDDCIIENLAELYAAYEGTKLVNGFKRERMHLYQGKDTLLGWGAFLDRRWIDEPILRYTERYGKDFVLMRDADRIVTSLLKVPKLTIPVKVKDFPSAMASYSLSLQQDHANYKAKALERCQRIRESEMVAV